MQSMTAFSRAERSFEQGNLVWEIKSVNHRYLEPTFRLPETFRDLEPKLREMLRGTLSRGKIDIALKWQPDLSASADQQVDQSVLEQLYNSLEQVNQVFQAVVQPSSLDILAWPGVLASGSGDQKQLKDEALAGFKAALNELKNVRLGEGQAIKPMLDERLQQINVIVSEVRAQMPEIIRQQNEQLKARIAEVTEQYDEARLETELVILAQKADVAEELDRLDAHVQEITDIIKRSEPIGRRLDFLMQELNREANTLSSKAIVLSSTNAAVELKVLIEQMREQIQNVE